MPSVNNYIIGLGGTGGAAVAAFRRATVLRHPEFEQLQQDGARFEYLYIDSDEDDIHHALHASSATWQVPGDEISLSYRELICLEGNGFTKDEAELNPDIASCLGNIDCMPDDVFASHLTGLTGARQRRRYGRMLFIRCMHEIREKLAQDIRSLLSESTDSHSITFHIFASLGGGTGSGCLMDTITLVHKLMPYKCEAKVMLYLFVGGKKIEGSPAAGGYFYPNEYCTLRDLNALMSGRWHPVLSWYRCVEEHDVSAPVTSVYISSDAGEQALNLMQQVEHTANVCFDTISLKPCEINGKVERNLMYMTYEHGIPAGYGECSEIVSPERDSQLMPRNGFPERSYRFRTVGVSRCKEPFMAIRTILKDEFAAQVNERRLNGSLIDRKDRRCSAQDMENQDIYDGTAILPGSPLSARCDQYDKEKLDAFAKAFDAASLKLRPGSYIKVNTYVQKTVYAIAEETWKDLKGSEWQTLCSKAAQERVQDITQKLLERGSWCCRHGRDASVWGIADIAVYLSSLVDCLSGADPYVKFQPSLGNMETREKELRTSGALVTFLFPQAKKEFKLHLQEGRAVIARALAKRREAMSALVELNMRFRTKAHCELIKQTGTILEEEIWRHQANAEEQIQQLRVTEPNVQLVFNERELMKHAQYLRSAEAEPELARSLAILESRYGTPEIEYFMLREANDRNTEAPNYWTESMRLHDELVRNRPDEYRPAFHASIYEALADLQRDNPQEYQDTLRRLCSGAQPLASVDTFPTGGAGLQISDIQPPFRAVVGGLPEAPPEAKNAGECVRDFVKREIGSMSEYYTYSHQDKHELRILSCLYWMPVRFFTFFPYLQRKMDEVLRSADRELMRTTLYLANIDDRDDEKPELVPIRITPEQCDIRSLFMLSCYLHIPQPEGEQNKHLWLAEISYADQLSPRLMHQNAVAQGPHTMVEYDSGQLRRSSAEFARHVRENVETWVKHYGETQADAVRERMHNEIEHLIGSGCQFDIIYDLLMRFEEIMTHFSPQA